MRISDWSSDVCSSDLVLILPRRHPSGRRFVAGRFAGFFGFGFGGARFVRGGAFGAQFLEQGFAVALETAVLGRLDPRLLRRFGDERVEFALRAEAERHRILGDDVGAVPVSAIADRADRVARRALGRASGGEGGWQYV